MKLTKQHLQNIIKEEIIQILREEKINEGVKDITLAGAIGLGSLVGGTASAKEPTQVIKQDIPDINKVAWISLHQYEISRLRAGEKLGNIQKVITAAKKALFTGEKIKNNGFYDEALSIAEDIKVKDPKQYNELIKQFGNMEISYQ